MEWEWDMKLGRRSPNLYNKKTKNAPHSMYVSPKSEVRGLFFFLENNEDSHRELGIVKTRGLQWKFLAKV